MRWRSPDPGAPARQLSSHTRWGPLARAGRQIHWAGARAAVRPHPHVALGRLSEHPRWAWFLLAPSMVLVGTIILYPTLYGIVLSFREMRLIRPDLGTGFVGLAHYRALLDDGVFWLALAHTALWVAIAIGLELPFGLLSALALNRGLRGFGAIGLLIVLPWFLPSVVVANVWALMLDPRLGVINDLLVRAGLLAQYKAWFADPATALLAAVVVEAWHGFPFFTLLLLAALKGIPGELYDAAAVDGAGVLQRFRYVTLPMLKVVIVAIVILRAIGLVNSPDLLLILTSGGPGHATQVLSLYAFETAYRGFDFGYAGALSVVMFVLLMALCYLYVRISGVLRSG
jgi:multiple sugar transport system permease protein